ncbi:L-seryl-tRNA(Sec) selenium transferase [Campylobacter sp. 34484-21]|uniref:L-seryl-tRNA(Sec) selenium transferase n=1 Tax=Campylobacter magnus TaxID=3026462 RepID=A0ABT8TB99_9BACT|nr:L-seryl-tRNA(Sec) selenium transferase [Campylobacter magnus]MDO2409137.1 L-seryl-tRNA(Sec) selenium transferase [Campylobacter magnus]
MQNLRTLPQIDKILNHKPFKDYNKGILARISRELLNSIRSNLKDEEINEEKIYTQINKNYKAFEKKALKPLINATGIVMHTNLGRSVIDEKSWQRAKQIACSYSNLEYDLESGSRGNRYDYTGYLLSTLFGCEDALVVNNNASAVFLVLNTFGKGGRCVISRGELVEIGGGFRVPEVMKESGAILAEVGTTNKTRLSDYENALDENTKMLVKVHRSNFDIVGFKQDTSLEEIAKLAKERGIISYYDLGGGAASSLACFNSEPVPQKLIKTGVDLLSFSGDKLFGSVQAGIILGKKELIAKLRKNQLLRMLRSDKITLALLASTVLSYLDKDYNSVPTVFLLSRSTSELKSVAKRINNSCKNIASIIDTATFGGGGTLPNVKIKSVALAFKAKKGQKIENLEREFRQKGVIGRIENQCFLLDLRSVLPSDESALITAINSIFGGQDE